MLDNLWLDEEEEEEKSFIPNISICHRFVSLINNFSSMSLARLNTYVEHRVETNNVAFVLHLSKQLLSIIDIELRDLLH